MSIDNNYDDVEVILGYVYDRLNEGLSNEDVRDECVNDPEVYRKIPKPGKFSEEDVIDMFIMLLTK